MRISHGAFHCLLFLLSWVPAQSLANPHSSGYPASVKD